MIRLDKNLLMQGTAVCLNPVGNVLGQEIQVTGLAQAVLFCSVADKANFCEHRGHAGAN